MAIDNELLEILRCPATMQPVTLADAALIERLNARIATGLLTNLGGERVDEPVDGALVREDQQVLYVIRDDIPEMLIDGAIRLADLG